MDIFRFKARNIRFHKCCDKFMTIACTSLSNVDCRKDRRLLIKIMSIVDL